MDAKKLQAKARYRYGIDSYWNDLKNDDEKYNEFLRKRRESNSSRQGTEWWAEVIKNRDYSHTQTKEWSEKSRKIKQKQLNDPVWKEKFDKRMKEVYKSDKFINAVNEANSSEERNKKISKAHSTPVKTPDRIFPSMHECALYYNITSEGVRYRCKTKEGWEQLKSGLASVATRKKLVRSGSNSREKRLKSIAAHKGYIYTPSGKFLSVREAWKQEVINELTADKNPHNWFKKMNQKFPEKYFKK